MWWIFAICGVLILVYRLLTHPYKYWVKKGVQQGSPLPLVGDNWSLLTRKLSFTEMIKMVYDMCPNTRYSGIYQFTTPTLVLRDPELIKQITVRDFDHFVDHRTFIPEDIDPIWANNLFALTGKRWHEIRTTLSPAFTSSKIKFMFSIIMQKSDLFVKYFLNKNENMTIVEMKDAFSRFTNDVIASTAFGVECDSLIDRNHEFYLMGKELTDFRGLWKNFKFFVCIMVPKLVKLLKLSLFSSKVERFFLQVVKSNIESREKHGIVRPDMIHLLLEANKSGKLKITDEEITSQALIFFFAGFESVSSLMCFMSYELALHPDIQARLIQEVDETLKTCEGSLNYESLLSMKYMDMVVSETLRKWPNAVVTDRICAKPYTIVPEHPNETPVHLKINDIVWVPTYGIHRDPSYYPDPERFDPERFNDENKKNIKSCTYLPFGSGPRGCIGYRFALLETKTLFFHILKHFQICPVEKTQIPLVLSKKQFTMTGENGFWLGLKSRVV